MDEKRTIFEHLGSIFGSYGASMVIMMVLCKIFGDSAKGYSNMFRLGSEGLPVETMLQFLLVVAIIDGIRSFFFSDKIIKKWSIAMRTACMIIVVIILISIFIVVYNWFPINMWEPWVLFLISFMITFSISTAAASYNEKRENQLMEEGLNRLKAKWEEEEREKE